MADSLASTGRIGWPGFMIAWDGLDGGTKQGFAVWIGPFMRGWCWKVAP